MGAPKQRWSKEEEEALKAGILKHGAGKWTTILKDPEFRSILALRSNVDLKDKFRNMGTLRSGERSGEASREKAAAALKRSKQNLVQDSSQLAPSGSNEDCPSVTKDAETLMVSVNSPESSGQNQENSKLENLILKAIACMKDRTGSSINSISSYIEDNFKYLPDSKQEIGEKLKEMAIAGKLEKVAKNKFKLAHNTNHSKGKFSKARSNEGRPKDSINSDGDAKNVVQNVDKPTNNAGIPQSRSKTAYEVAVEAAQAVAKAEVLMAEAKEAQKQLELAEACAYASDSLLKKLDMEINRRNASAQVAAM